jgi:hypothetical protein
MTITQRSPEKNGATASGEEPSGFVGASRIPKMRSIEWVGPNCEKVSTEWTRALAAMVA